MFSGKKLLLLIAFFCFFVSVNCQTDTINLFPEVVSGKTKIFGFVRSGFYSGIDKEDANTPYISSAFAYLALKVNTENEYNFKAYADLRFRYGSEFQEPVNTIYIREGYVRFYGKQWDVTAGQQIVKWGRADFTNPTSKINPQIFASRSPDRSEMDMGNILADIKWHPSAYISIGTVLVPFYRSSVLIIDPMPVPDFVTINQINSLLTDKEMFSYGLKSDIHLRGIDFSISWFDGYDPMPGTELTSFSLDMSGTLPIPHTELTFKPYKTKIIGIDFESSIGNVGIRGEAAWSKPYLSFETNEFVPFAEIDWVAGSDISFGAWRFLFEYSGKKILEFSPSEVDPVLSGEQDFSELMQYFSKPGFNPEDYIRQQVGALNRLYNYQLEQYYHSAGLRVEADLVHGKLMPSLFTLHNFTSRDFLLIPELKYKPSDGLTISAGVEYYKGLDDSLYDLADDFMNSFYIALKVDF